MPGQYRKGANFERQVAAHLTEMGADTTRSAGSHTVKDLVAVWPKPDGATWYIQCKINGRLKPEEREALLELEKEYPIVPMLAYKIKRKIVFIQVKSKEPTFHYEVIDGVFTKVDG